MFNFNISSFFGGSSSSGSGLFGSINLSDYRMIKSGSYKKLMKAYYAEEKGTTSSKSSSKSSEKKSVLDQLLERKDAANKNDTTGVSKMKSQADSLKAAADAFNKTDDFKQDDGSYDTEKLAKAVNNFVSKYNSAIDQAGKTVSNDVSAQVGYMKSMTNTMSKSLAKVGITVGADGKLSVNEDTLKNAGQKDIDAMFLGKNSYVDAISDKAGAIGSAALRDTNFYSSNGSWSKSTSNVFNNWV